MPGTPARRTIVEVLAAPGDVVDDLRRALAAVDVEVRIGDGHAGAEAAGGGPDVVVADLDGLALLGGRSTSVPVLALARRQVPDDLARAFAGGATDVLPVPLLAAEAAARVAGVVHAAAAEARLAARNAELSAWAARAGHDLMTPLAVIGGMAETLEAAWDRLPEPDRGRLLGAIRNQVAKATAMLTEALTLARQAPAPADEAPTGGSGPP